MSDQSEPVRWAIVEIMGHHKLAGIVSEEEFAGTKMLRVDVPETVGKAPVYGDYRIDYVDVVNAGYTKYYGASAIFGIEICSEAVARAEAARCERVNHPVPYEPKRIGAGPTEETVEEDDFEDDIEPDGAAWDFGDVASPLVGDVVDPDNVPEGPEEEGT